MSWFMPLDTVPFWALNAARMSSGEVPTPSAQSSRVMIHSWS